MDLHSIEKYLCPQTFDEIEAWQAGSTWLAGGTWMFTEPQLQVKTLIDITQLGWSEIEVTAEGLSIGATCILSDLLHTSYPDSWKGVEALKGAVHELASFKVQNVATVGGNLCLALPAGTFAPAMVLLGASYTIVSIGGSPYTVPALDFQTGAKKTLLQPGELLQSIWIPKQYLEWQVSYQRICVASAGLALSIVLAAYHPPTKQVRFAIGAAAGAPKLLEFDHIPSVAEYTDALDAQIPPESLIGDEFASAAYRRHVTLVLMERSLQEATQSI